MIRTLLLDAAGTLIEPAEPVAAVYARHFAASGWPVPEPALRDAFRAVFTAAPPPAYETAGDGDAAERRWWRGVVEDVLRACGVSPEPGPMEECFVGLFDHYAAGPAWRVFPEVRPALEEWKKEGLRLAVVSNFDLRLHGILADLGLTGFFETVVTSADAWARKPSPGIFRLALDRLGVEATAAAHVGDHPVADGEGGAGVGLKAFVLRRPEVTLKDAKDWLERKKRAK